MFGGYIPGQQRVNDVYSIDLESMVSPSLIHDQQLYGFHKSAEIHIPITLYAVIHQSLAKAHHRRMLDAWILIYML